MKKIRKYLSAIGLALMLFAACKKDSPKWTKDGLVGGWYLAFYGIDSNRNNILDANELYEAPINSPITVTIRFNSEGTFVARNFICCTSNRNSGTWELLQNNNVLRLIIDSKYTMDYTIITLDTTTLITRDDFYGYNQLQIYKNK